MKVKIPIGWLWNKVIKKAPKWVWKRIDDDLYGLILEELLRRKVKEGKTDELKKKIANAEVWKSMEKEDED